MSACTSLEFSKPPVPLFALTKIAVPEEFQQFCWLNDQGEGCNSWQWQVIEYESALGRLVQCSGCGRWWLKPFSRTTTELSM
jgi:hypothetical protein